jgi:hypothetical protein
MQEAPLGASSAEISHGSARPMRKGRSVFGDRGIGGFIWSAATAHATHGAARSDSDKSSWVMAALSDGSCAGLERREAMVHSRLANGTAPDPTEVPTRPRHIQDGRRVPTVGQPTSPGSMHPGAMSRRPSQATGQPTRRPDLHSSGKVFHLVLGGRASELRRSPREAGRRTFRAAANVQPMRVPRCKSRKM